MGQVVVSYAEEDEEAAKNLVFALRNVGWSVWWSKDLLPGTPYEEVIKKEIEDAACVVVLWSRVSAESEWVRDEARAARDLKKLFPVRIDDTKIPLGFDSFHLVNLTGWDGSISDSRFSELAAGLGRVVKTSSEPIEVETPAVKNRGDSGWRWSQWVSRKLVAYTIAVFIVLDIAFLLYIFVPRPMQFSGEKIRVTLRDADIHDVLKTLSDAAKINIIVDPGVSGQVTADMHDVAWDQALSHILQSVNLDYVREGEVIRVRRSSRMLTAYLLSVFIVVALAALIFVAKR